MTDTPTNRGQIVPAKRPKSYTSVSEEYQSGCGSIFVHVSSDKDGNPVELFANMGKAGGCSMAMIEAVGKSTSIGLRCGISPQVYVKQFVGIRCPSPSWEDGEQHLSCIDAMGKALRDAIVRKDKQQDARKKEQERQDTTNTNQVEGSE